MTTSINGMIKYYNSVFNPVYRNSFSYKSINSFSPLSNLTVKYNSKQVQNTVSTYLSNLSANVNTLKTSAKSFNGIGINSSFDKKAVSSDSTSIAAKASYNAEVKAYTLNVSNIAKAQTNTGNTMNAIDKSSFTTGINTIAIKIGTSSEKKISFTINEADTNKTSLEKMANAINRSDIGINAIVKTDTKTGKSFIEAMSAKTGKASGFTITDIAGNSVSASGISSITQNSENAKYTLDGKEYISESNTINLDSGKIEATISKAEGKDVKLTVSSDVQGIKADITKLVDSYNSLKNFAEKNSEKFVGASKLDNELGNIVKAKKLSLEAIGISVNEDGTLSVDSSKLEKNISTNMWRVKNTLSGKNSFGEKLLEESNRVVSSPMSYAQPLEFSRNNMKYYNNYNFAFNTAINNQNIYSGMLFDTIL